MHRTKCIESRISRQILTINKIFYKSNQCTVYTDSEKNSERVRLSSFITPRSVIHSWIRFSSVIYCTWITENSSTRQCGLQWRLSSKDHPVETDSAAKTTQLRRTQHCSPYCWASPVLSMMPIVRLRLFSSQTQQDGPHWWVRVSDGVLAQPNQTHKHAQHHWVKLSGVRHVDKCRAQSRGVVSFIKRWKVRHLKWQA
jgi:hypothetical protein